MNASLPPRGTGHAARGPGAAAPFRDGGRGSTPEFHPAPLSRRRVPLGPPAPHQIPG